jgi:hypothetical protein
MAFDLLGKAGSFRMSNSGWPELLAIAETYGWKPAGTTAPKGVARSKWEGGYHTCDGQLISAGDAQALATAIDQALDDNFKRVPTDTIEPATDSERQNAFDKLASVAAGMSVEYVKAGKKPAPKSKGPKKLEKGKGAGSLEELVAGKGMSMEDLMGQLAALRSPAAAATAPEPWFITSNGQQHIREFLAFCRAGQFRIQ